MNGECLGSPNPYNLSEKYFGDRKGTTKKNFVTKILPNVRVNFLVRFASKPLFYWIMTSNPSNCSENSLVLFARIFGFMGPFWPLSTCGTPPICTAVRPPFVTLVPRWLQSFGERETLQYTSNLYCSMPPICTAVRAGEIFYATREWLNIFRRRFGSFFGSLFT